MLAGPRTSRRRCLASLKAAWGLLPYLPTLRLPFALSPPQFMLRQMLEAL